MAGIVANAPEIQVLLRKGDLIVKPGTTTGKIQSPIGSGIEEASQGSVPFQTQIRRRHQRIAPVQAEKRRSYPAKANAPLLSVGREQNQAVIESLLESPILVAAHGPLPEIAILVLLGRVGTLFPGRSDRHRIPANHRNVFCLRHRLRIDRLPVLKRARCRKGIFRGFLPLPLGRQAIRPSFDIHLKQHIPPHPH